MREKLTLVTSFSSLKAGDAVVVKGCGKCARDHRGVLINFEKTAPCLATNGNVTTEDTWEVLPHGSCGCGFIGRYDVETHRCVYRIDTGLESSDDYRETISVDEQLAAVRSHQRQKERTR